MRHPPPLPQRAVTLAMLLLLASTASGQGAALAAAPWTVEEVGLGVQWRSCTFADLYGRPQNVHVLEVDLSEGGVAIEFLSPGGLRRTSDLARASTAVAAVNGGFFDPEGKPVGLLRARGQDQGGPHPDRTWALVMRRGGQMALEEDAACRWPGAPDVLSAGPPLVRRGRVESALAANQARHPRTAAGLDGPRRLLLVTVDGRTDSSAGMTFVELAQLLVALGAKEALNLDGGGSTTMWVRGEPGSEVVNCPCDNRRFDHQGERPVGNVILVHARDVIVADTDEAELLPEGSWERSDRGRGYLGRDYALSRQDGARALWLLSVELPGNYEVFVRWPDILGLTPEAHLRAGSLEAKLAQKFGGGSWRSGGQVEISEAGRLTLELQNGGRGRLAADAVRLVQAR